MKLSGYALAAACIAATFLFTVTSPADAEAVGAGVGIRTCGQFAKDYQNNPANTEIVYNNWALGFMSGMNAVLDATDKPKRDLEAVSFEDKKRFMREFCDSHPLQIYMGGVIELMWSLPVMRQAP